MVTIRRIVCCCGNGLGSSLIVQMNLEKVLTDLNITGVQVSHHSVSEVYEYSADLFVIGKDLEAAFLAMPRKNYFTGHCFKRRIERKAAKSVQNENRRILYSLAVWMEIQAAFFLNPMFF